MITLSQILQHYKREDIQNEIIENAKDREVAIKFGDKGFGKRPDILKYPKDVLELAKQGATSFHASEELWKSPLQLDPMMKRLDVEKLRTGWDLVLDIDCENWDIAKITTWLIVESLKEHGIKSISAKFSGNKGFHIGVPFETFPTNIGNDNIKNLFPIGARVIAEYLLDYISKKHIEVTSDEIIVFGNKFKISFQTLKCIANKSKEALTYWYCKKCERKFKMIDEKQKVLTVGSNVLDMVHKDERKDFYTSKTKEEFFKKKPCNCLNAEYIRLFNPLSVINVDTILISPRHLYRMPYSFHEKSGLVSVPINPNKVLDFRKEIAIPKNVRVSKYRFLDKNKVEEKEAMNLFIGAFEFAIKKEEVRIEKDKQYELPEHAIPEQFFPPCINLILKGLSDGRKRSLFILTNFLTSVGWSYEQIEKLLEEWNKKNTEPLREVLIKGQIRYHKQKAKKILPPNCANSMYYKDFRVCVPDNLCQKIKNPVNYSMIKTRYLEEGKGKEKKE